MGIFERGNVRLNYEEHGEGFPVLLIAPGGMNSCIDKWSMSPWNPIDELAKSYRVVAMDQRNAGASTAPISGADGWATYTADQLALMDHLGHDRFHVGGMCIGGAYIAGLIQAAPERIASALVFQTIGLDNNEQAFFDMFDMWANELRGSRDEVSEADWDSFRANMYDTTNVLFTASEDQLRELASPMLVLMGNDLYHPESSSRVLAANAPNATLVEQWKQGEHIEPAKQQALDFLATHTP